jgi:hypothetical protein
MAIIIKAETHITASKPHLLIPRLPMNPISPTLARGGKEGEGEASPKNDEVLFIGGVILAKVLLFLRGAMVSPTDGEGLDLLGLGVGVLTGDLGETSSSAFKLADIGLLGVLDEDDV